MGVDTAGTGTGSRRSALRRLGVLALVVGSALVVAWQLGAFEAERLQQLVRLVRRARTHVWFYPAFVGAYALLISLGLPASPLTIAGGAAFGFAHGTALNYAGAVLGAVGGYAHARLYGGGTLRALLGRHTELVERLRRHGGALTLLRLRLFPVIPFTIMNFACGMARVPLRRYAAATIPGVLPGTAVYTYFADRLLSGAAGVDRQALLHAALVGAALLALTFVARLFDRRHRGS